ncbi:MAG: OmpA family protein [Bacteroidota bacterium]
MRLHLVLLFSLLQISITAQTFDTLQLLSSAEVYFDFGQSDIRPDADSTLQSFVQNLAAATDSIYITAHTDSIGNPARNYILSQKRAAAVRDTLVRLGLPDSLFQIAVFGEQNPISSNQSEAGRQRNRRASIDAFRKVKMRYISGQITDPTTGKGIESDVIVRSKIHRDSVHTDSAGYFKAKAPAAGVVGIDVFAKDYFFETLMQRITTKNEPIDVKLQPLAAGASIDLKNFYFVGNEAVLLKSSQPELPKLLRFMQYNKDLKIEIAGHVNRPNALPVGTQTFSYQLSVDRAKMVYEYLEANGISTDRMKYKGYGNWKMRYPNARSAKQQAANRRVEIKVLSVK